MTEPTSDFPEFDQAYQSVLVKDHEDKFERLAAQANFNVYHSDIWRGTGRKFAELIIKECVSVCMDHRVGKQDYNTGRLHCSFDIKDHFGVEE